MKTFRTFEELQQFVGASGKRRRIVVVKPEDDATCEALRLADEQGVADIIPIDDKLPERAAEKAVALIRRGDADVLMKGLIGTDILLRAILNKVSGLLPEGRVLIHLSVAEIPTYPKLLFFTDVAVIPSASARRTGSASPWASRLTATAASAAR